MNKSLPNTIDGPITFKYLFSDDIIADLKAIESQEQEQKQLNSTLQEEKRNLEAQQKIDTFNSHKEAAIYAFNIDEYKEAQKQFKLAYGLNKSDAELISFKEELLSKLKGINKKKFLFDIVIGVTLIIGLRYLTDTFIELENRSNLSSFLSWIYIVIVIMVLLRAFRRWASIDI